MSVPFPDVDRTEQLQRSIHTGFLYPFRFRVAEAPSGPVQAGDYVMVNLRQSGMYFSYGVYSCRWFSFADCYSNLGSWYVGRA